MAWIGGLLPGLRSGAEHKNEHRVLLGISPELICWGGGGRKCRLHVQTSPLRFRTLSRSKKRNNTHVPQGKQATQWARESSSHCDSFEPHMLPTLTVNLIVCPFWGLKQDQAGLGCSLTSGHRLLAFVLLHVETPKCPCPMKIHLPAAWAVPGVGNKCRPLSLATAEHGPNPQK